MKIPHKGLAPQAVRCSILLGMTGKSYPSVGRICQGSMECLGRSMGGIKWEKTDEEKTGE